MDNKFDFQSPYVVLMVGLPSSGKNNTVNYIRRLNMTDNPVHVSSDNELHDIGVDLGIVDDKGAVFYEDVISFQVDGEMVHYEEAKNRMNRRLDQFVGEGRNIIVNRTHVIASERAEILNKIPHNYNTYAVVMDTDFDTIWERIKRDDKEVPLAVLESKINAMERVGPKEGFYKIIRQGGTELPYAAPVREDQRIKYATPSQYVRENFEVLMFSDTNRKRLKSTFLQKRAL